MTEVTLSAEQARFVAEVVANGRYPDVSAVVHAALAGLARFEAERAALLASVQAAEAEGDRDGYFSVETVEAEMRAVIQEAAAPA